MAVDKFKPLSTALIGSMPRNEKVFKGKTHGKGGNDRERRLYEPCRRADKGNNRDAGRFGNRHNNFR